MNAYLINRNLNNLNLKTFSYPYETTNGRNVTKTFRTSFQNYSTIPQKNNEILNAKQISTNDTRNAATHMTTSRISDAHRMTKAFFFCFPALRKDMQSSLCREVDEMYINVA